MSTPMNRADRRRYKKRHGRSVWVFSELNEDLRPGDLAKIITSAGLEKARLEAEALADEQARQAAAAGAEAPDA